MVRSWAGCLTVLRVLLLAIVVVGLIGYVCVCLVYSVVWLVFMVVCFGGFVGIRCFGCDFCVTVVVGHTCFALANVVCCLLQFVVGFIIASLL